MLALSFISITGILILYFFISRKKVQWYLSLKLLAVRISFELSSVVVVFRCGQNWKKNLSSDIMQLFTL